MFVLQTTTVREFNEVFYDLERKLQVDADMEGVQPKWPSLSKVIGLATNACRRLKASGVWDGVATKRSKACNLTRSNPSPSSPPGFTRCFGYLLLLSTRVEAKVVTGLKLHRYWPLCPSPVKRQCYLEWLSPSLFIADPVSNGCYHLSSNS